MAIKDRIKENLVMILMVMIVGIVVNSSVVTVFANEQIKTSNVQVGDLVPLESIYETSIIQTSTSGMSFFSLNDGNVEMKDTEEVCWIDRIADLPDEIEELYEMLEEGSDNDKENDFLIEDDYYEYNNSVIIVAKSYENNATITSEYLVNEMNTMYAQYSPYIFATMCAFDRDHPEVFWLNDQWTTGAFLYYQDGMYIVTVELLLVNTGYGVDIRAEGYQSEGAIKSAIAHRDNAVKDILKGYSGKSNYEKLRYFNETLTKINEYNTSYDLNTINADCYTCMSGLTGRIGIEGPVCEGYARAFKVLCDQVDIPCVLVDGYGIDAYGNGEAHMWNNVCLADSWYAVDVTWNDPVVDDAHGAISSYESEDWFLVGNGTIVNGMEFAESHILTNAPMTNLTFTNGPELCKESYSLYSLTDAVVTLEIPEKGYVYDATMKEPEVSVDLHGTELTLNEDYEVSYENNVNAGTDSAVVIVEGIGDYAGSVEAKFSIKKRIIVPSFTIKKVYDGTVDAKFEVIVDDIIEDDNVQVNISGTYTNKDAGMNIPMDYALVLTGKDAENYQVDMPDEVTGIITPRPVTVYAMSGSKPYGNNDSELGYCVEGIIENEKLNGLLSREEGEDAGTYMIQQGTLTSKNNPNYEITFVGNEFKIIPVSYTVDMKGEQQINKDNVNFVESVCRGVNGEIVEGILTYSIAENVNLTYDQVVLFVADMELGEACTVIYSFLPTDNNYTGEKTGEFILMMDGCMKGYIGKNCPSHHFKDLDLNQWYHLNVDYVVSHGLMNGVNSTSFGPNTVTTRAMIVTILYRMDGASEVQGYSSFTDIPKDAYFAKAVAWAASNGIVTGVSETQFAPDKAITREQMLCMLYRYANYLNHDTAKLADLSGFADEKAISSYAKNPLEWAYGASMITGETRDGKFFLNPQGQTTRAQAAAFINRFCNEVGK